MSLTIPSASLPPQVIVQQWGERVAAIRLSRNLTQAQVATQAGVSVSSIKRLEAGGNASLDTFVRVLTALGLTDHLSAALPDPAVRPVERVQHHGQQRQRARRHSTPAAPTPWVWGVSETSADEDDE